MDSRFVRAAETVARTGRGYDAGNYLERLIMSGVLDQGWSSMARLGDLAA